LDLQDPSLVDVTSTSGSTFTAATELSQGTLCGPGGASSLENLYHGVQHVQSWAQIGVKCLVLRLSHSRVQAVFRDGSLLLIHQRKNLLLYKAAQSGGAGVAGAAPHFIEVPLDGAAEYPEVLKRVNQVRELQLNL
jgi:hypothetical protein